MIDVGSRTFKKLDAIAKRIRNIEAIEPLEGFIRCRGKAGGSAPLG